MIPHISQLDKQEAGYLPSGARGLAPLCPGMGLLRKAAAPQRGFWHFDVGLAHDASAPGLRRGCGSCVCVLVPVVVSGGRLPVYLLPGALSPPLASPLGGRLKSLFALFLHTHLPRAISPPGFPAGPGGMEGPEAPPRVPCPVTL